MAEAARPAATRDAFFGGRLVLAQPATGHRAGTDAVLLAAAAPRDVAGQVLDMGAATGIVGLAVAQVSPRANVMLVETDPTSVLLARDNIESLGLGDRVEVVACDLLSREARRAHLTTSADLVLTNPPYRCADAVRSSPDVARSAAHVLAASATLEDWIGACLACLAPKGSLVMIHEAAAAPALLGALSGRLGRLTLLPIHPRAGAAATRVLVRGTMGSRAPFRLVPALVLHDGDRFTQQAAALHEGRALLDW